MELLRCHNCIQLNLDPDRKTKLDIKHGANFSGCPFKARFIASRERQNNKDKKSAAKTVPAKSQRQEIQTQQQQQKRQSRSRSRNGRSSSTPRVQYESYAGAIKGTPRRQQPQPQEQNHGEQKESCTQICNVMASAYDRITNAPNKFEQRRIAFEILQCL